MEDRRLTIRIPRDLLDAAERYAQENNTTVTRLITVFLRQLAARSDPLADAPIVRRLSGTLSPDVSLEEYWRYVEQKYRG